MNDCEARAKIQSVTEHYVFSKVAILVKFMFLKQNIHWMGNKLSKILLYEEKQLNSSQKTLTPRIVIHY